jgi:hypothetical protein
MTLSKKNKNKNYGRAHELINMNHTMSLTKQGTTFLKKIPLQKYISRDGLSRLQIQAHPCHSS